MYMLRGDSRSVKMTVRVNDIPLLALSGNSLSDSAEFISQWLVEGENRLEIAIEAATPPAEAAGSPVTTEKFDGRRIPEEAEVWATVIKLPPGQSHGVPGGKPVCELRWSATDAAVNAVLPLRESKGFIAEHAPGMRWRRSSPPDGEAARSQLANWLLYLAQAIEAGQTDVLVTAREPGIRDLCEATGQDPQIHIDRFSQMLSQYVAGRSIRSFTSADLAFERIAGGTLIEVTRTDGSPVLRPKPETGGDFEMQTRVGFLEGEWKLF